MRRFVTAPAVRALLVVLTLALVVVLVRMVDLGELVATFERAMAEPERLLLAMACFGLAFVIRAVAWKRLVPSLGFAHSLSGIHLTLGANHVLPFRLGEPFRVLSATRRAGLGLEASAASTVTLRAADIVAVVALGALAAPAAFFDLIGIVGWFLLVAVALVAAFGWRWMAAVAGRSNEVRMPDIVTFLLAVSAWLAESVLVWQTARWAGIELGWTEAILVTAVAVAAQVAAVAPGGFGTYEAAAVAAYAVLGHGPEQALVAALAAHGLKTGYSLVAGAIAAFVPAPGMFGRFRLGEARSATVAGATSATVQHEANGPILLFMPAYNEEASVAACIRRAPSEVLGHPVQTLVIDDGSADRTVSVAESAGAEVHSLGVNRGLGAAVRVGLAEGVDRGAAAVVFCDADGEYPPEELANLVAPILADEADYVIGSRFLGRIDHMRPHRRFGNVVLTRCLSIIARRRISDGQSGYRAFSPRAAADAEVIHDFNYAQVLTLDLLAKGYRYREVPISYHFRTEGESFIKLGRYLRNVVPAVYRELNTG